MRAALYAPWPAGARRSWGAGAIALVIGFYLLQPGTAEGAPSAPGFVYGIVFTIFVFFNTFALNQWAQYAAVGRWQDYVVGEKTYQVLSLTAKSVLAWEIFANTLIPA